MEKQRYRRKYKYISIRLFKEEGHILSDIIFIQYNVDIDNLNIYDTICLQRKRSIFNKICKNFSKPKSWINTIKTLIRKDEENNMNHIQMLVNCAYMRGVADLQHRTIAEFAQFVEDVMSDKPEYQKYRFDWNSHDAIEKWIEMFHKHCKECYRNIEERLCIDEEYL